MLDLQPLNAAFRISEEVEKIKNKNANTGKNDRPHFNFFVGLTSNKTHIEQYHTWFISYLLSANQHDGGDFFLKHFLQMLHKRCSPNSGDTKLTLLEALIKQVENKNNISVCSEQTISTGRVDIEIIFQTMTAALFIENKMRSYEGNNQMLAYFQHYVGEFPDKCLGIYLTKKGDYPYSVSKESPYFKNLIPLSYRNIIAWLEACQAKPELLLNPHIKGSIQQYIQAIKNELNTMGELNLEETENYLKGHVNEFSVLVKNQSAIENAIQSTVKIIRDTFLEDLWEILTRSLDDTRYSFKGREKGGKALYKYNELSFFLYVTQGYPEIDGEGKGLWWGVYNEKDQQFNVDFGLKNNCWETVCLEDVPDYMEHEKGSAIIIECTEDPERRNRLLNKIVNTIGSELELKVIPELTKNKNKGKP